ncbi:Fungalysin metallopeptidase-domain-containing protein [Dimargaris cristalligena]|uniref:Extracellular metalloproteinase n=1 Tax=Dimargaris cristalligena TaxID=215637 RepID=A0A4P9ZQ52_9FUNG|nr:Fungalysin metallopeptidase-domain-containing protein [Dimargaris cristalligena]|eukprot:RKP35457.1 Fungalysin metallopeptidase-domain-containing protein [Dimargaris cristalligena]
MGGLAEATSPVDKALKFATETFRLADNQLVVKNSYTSTDTGISHVYLRQMVGGFEIDNADMNINIDQEGKVISYGSTFLAGDHEQILSLVGDRPLENQADAHHGPKTPKINSLAALNAVLTKVGLPDLGKTELKETHSKDENGQAVITYAKVPGSVDDHTTLSLSYLITGRGRVEPVWDVVLHTVDDWYNAHVSRASGEVVAMVSWKSHVSYNIYGIGNSNPLRGIRKMTANPADIKASPKGWHDNGVAPPFNDTMGNNVLAQEDQAGTFEWTNKKRPSAGKDMVFDFPIDFKKIPAKYTDASVVNLFYWSNLIHDLYYRFGFDEEAGNFQDNNFSKGGRSDDGVLAFAQSGKGMNDAWFVTPPDGSRPTMNIYNFNMTTPLRDASLDADIIIHEYTHGVSTRLTGGPANSNCLSTPEAAGLGEGWSDALALLLQLKSTDTRETNYGIGAYVSDRAEGLRKYVYSTSVEENPNQYNSLNGWTTPEVHITGEVWASILYEVIWNMVDTAGFEKNLGNATAEAGNILVIRYIINGMKLQPCNPTFLAARDAIIQAEGAITKGKYKCQLWKGFAKRGLGHRATNVLGVRFNSYTVPADC